MIHGDQSLARDGCRDPGMRHDPGTVRGNLQALQPAGSVHPSSAPRAGPDTDFDTLSSQARSTFYGCRTGQLTPRREFSGLTPVNSVA